MFIPTVYEILFGLGIGLFVAFCGGVLLGYLTERLAIWMSRKH